TPGLLTTLRHVIPVAAVVYSDPESSYRIAAFAPVYICVAPPGHVADTKQNEPRRRMSALPRLARTGGLAFPAICGARWLVVHARRFPRLGPARPVAYRDSRYVLYRLR